MPWLESRFQVPEVRAGGGVGATEAGCRGATPLQVFVDVVRHRRVGLVGSQWVAVSPQVTLQVLHRAAEAASSAVRLPHARRGAWGRLGRGGDSASPCSAGREGRGRRWALRAAGAAGRGPARARGPGGGAGGCASGVTVVAWCCRGRKRGGESRSVAAAPPPTPALPPAAPRPSHRA